MRKWLKLPHVEKWFHEPQNWIDELDDRFDRFSFITHLIVLDGDNPIGFCQYYPVIDAGEKWYGRIPLENTYSIDYMIGDTDYLSRGLAPKIITLLTEKIFKETNAKRIIVKPEEENLKSRRALAKALYDYDFDNCVFIKYKK